jgi:GntR family transcriptional regulator
MPVLHIDLARPEPAYRQIADGLRCWLVSEELPPGARLPPVRRLALDLGVHHNTVAEAYRRLAAEGWLELTPGRGAIVRRRAEARLEPEEKRALEQRLEKWSASALASGWSRVGIARRLEALAAQLREGRAKEDNK